MGKVLEWLLWTPIAWLAGNLASMFYPFEGDKRYDALSMLFSLIIVILLIVLCAWLF